MGESVKQQTTDFLAHYRVIQGVVRHTKAKKVLEIGTDVGDSTRIFATALKETGGEIVTVDIKPVDQSWAKDYPNIRFATGSSKNLKLDQPIDILYLDGEHSYEMVSHELKELGKWVRKDGYILLHDSCHDKDGPAVTRAIREWCAANGFVWTEDPQQHGLAMIEVTRDLTR